MRKQLVNKDGTFNGDVLREKRKALGFTLKELSWRVEMSLGYLAQIEKGFAPGALISGRIVEYFEEIETHGKEVKIRLKPMRVSTIKAQLETVIEPLYRKE